ncbi:MAG TPA: RT0821/Lpp0805 family surface protein, partial [Acetobacteraceae bacterium]|nr:RT0821/Lpp0805 family surface protein [Acetobacteraceae bacterium]
LAPGKSVTFQATRHTVEGVKTSEITESWQCRVDGTAHVATSAGDFDTFRVVCTVSTVPATNVLTRTFFYAPAINYYVRREDRTGANKVSTITLTSHTTAEPTLSTQAIRSRDAARQTALETLPSGQTQTWQDPASGSRGTVRPISTARSPKYGWCRTYQETVQASTHSHTAERTACRIAGNWQTISG